MAFWRDDAAKVNGFDERYVGWGFDDDDFAIRLIRAGIDWRRIRFLGAVYHFEHESRPFDPLTSKARFEETCRRLEFRIPDEFGLARAIAEGPERIER